MILDDTDKRLVEALRKNSRTPIADLARQLSMSRSTIKDRLDRLEHSGVIKGYTLVLGDDVTKTRISAHVMVKISSDVSGHIIRRLKEMPCVSKAYAISGMYDLIAMVDAESTGELDQVLDDVRAIEGIQETLTSVVLSTKFEK